MRTKGGRKRGSTLATRIAEMPVAQGDLVNYKFHKPGSQQTERKFIGRKIRGKR